MLSSHLVEHVHISAIYGHGPAGAASGFTGTLKTYFPVPSPAAHDSAGPVGRHPPLSSPRAPPYQGRPAGTSSDSSDQVNTPVKFLSI